MFSIFRELMHQYHSSSLNSRVRDKSSSILENTKFQVILQVLKSVWSSETPSSWMSNIVLVPHTITVNLCMFRILCPELVPIGLKMLQSEQALFVKYDNNSFVQADVLAAGSEVIVQPNFPVSMDVRVTDDVIVSKDGTVYLKVKALRGTHINSETYMKNSELLYHSKWYKVVNVHSNFRMLIC